MGKFLGSISDYGAQPKVESKKPPVYRLGKVNKSYWEYRLCGKTIKSLKWSSGPDAKMTGFTTVDGNVFGIDGCATLSYIEK
jgi:hypothetical protein